MRNLLDKLYRLPIQYKYDNNRGEKPLLKRIFSAFLAACMLSSYAFAAEDTEKKDEQEISQSENADEMQSETDISKETAPEDENISGGEIIEEPPTTPAEPDQVLFPDVPGHWAEKELIRAVELGLLKGIDGKMMPNTAVKRSESVTILNRVLGASIEDSISSMGQIPSGAWYYSDIAKAAHLGLIDVTDKGSFNISSTRAQAFVLFARAFGYNRAEQSENVLAGFPDTTSMTPEQKRAASALISAGIIKGNTNGKLEPTGNLTRAEFVTMLLRIVSDFPQEEVSSDIYNGTLFSNEEIILENSQLIGDCIFACETENISLLSVDASGRLVLKGSEDISFKAKGGSVLSDLISDSAGSATLSLDNQSTLETLVLAGIGGDITYSGDAQNIEITAQNRTINLSGMTAQKLSIVGSGNTVIMDGKVAVVEILASAKNTSLTLNDTVGALKVSGIGTKVKGSGKAKSVDIRAINCDISIETEEKTEEIDSGLHGISIKFGVPTKVLPGGTLLTQVTFDNVLEDKICKAEWYQDGKAINGFSSDAFVLSSETVSRHTSYFTFSKDMQKDVTMGFKLTYENPSTGETETLYNEVTVPIENHSAEWYYQRDVDRVLNLVSSTYRGNYTIKYATDNDYQSYEKEVFVNAKGYSSNSGYLLWINRAYQHVNVFTGSKGNWKLHKSFLVGTGASSSPTPTGITTVSYKSAAGWTTSTYTVKPVVGFYPGTGYAFHSRLYYPGTTKINDYSIGYPISHGCIRMYDEDVQWIYNTVPVGTTVVIF